MKRILLLGCGGSAGINFVKALRLAKEKIFIVGVDKNRYYLEISPVDEAYYAPYQKGDEKEYIDKLNTLIKKYNIQFVHAQPDPEVKILSDFRHVINARTFLPTKTCIDTCQDKWQFYLSLKKVGVPIAKTFLVKSSNDLRHAFKRIKDPIIWIRAKRGAGGKASLPVKNYRQASMWIEYWFDRGLGWNDFLVSEYLPGNEVSWLSIWKDGRLVCSQQKERTEWVQGQIAPSGVGGTTAIQKTVEYPVVNKIATAAVFAVDKKPNGIYVVDTKENKNYIPCVTEINAGRFFTTSLFFATLGVNMPLIYVLLGLHLPIPEVSQYNAVSKNIHWIRVVDGGPTVVKNEKWRSKTL